MARAPSKPPQGGTRSAQAGSCRSLLPSTGYVAEVRSGCDVHHQENAPGWGSEVFVVEASSRYPDKFQLHSLSPSRQSPVFRRSESVYLPQVSRIAGRSTSGGAPEMEHTPSSRPAIPRRASDAKSETSPGSTTAAAMSAATAPTAVLSPASSLGPGGGPPRKRSRASEGASGRERERERAGVPRVSYPKKRVNVACEVCRSRKTRCDAARPSCSFCAEIGARCMYRRPEETSRLVPPPGVDWRCLLHLLDSRSHPESSASFCCVAFRIPRPRDGRFRSSAPVCGCHRWEGGEEGTRQSRRAESSPSGNLSECIAQSLPAAG